jgi:hypothetical protein
MGNSSRAKIILHVAETNVAHLLARGQHCDDDSASSSRGSNSRSNAALLDFVRKCLDVVGLPVARRCSSHRHFHPLPTGAPRGEGVDDPDSSTAERLSRRSV